MKNKKISKVMISLIATSVLGTAAVLPVTLNGVTLSAYAETTAPSTSNLVIHKLQYTGTTPSIINDGSEVTLPGEVSAYNPAKYGEVKFSLVDITAYAKTKTVEQVQSELSALQQSNYASWIAANGSVVAEKAVGADGSTDFTNVAASNANGESRIYAILETKSSTGLVTAIAQPIVVSLPMTNAAGNGFLDTVNLYPKNQVTDLTLTLTKYAEAISAGNELTGAEFDLYSGKPGTGTKINTASLTTNAKGEIEVTGLTMGDYYLVETKAPEGYVISGNAKNNADNKLTFSISAEGIDPASLDIDFINYKTPGSEKKVTNGTAPETNESTFSIGDLVDYKNTIAVPTDIAGGTFTNVGETEETTHAYTVFNYTDIGGTGLTYNGNEASVVVTGADGTKLVLGTDYTYTAKENGFLIDFIVNNGKVSDTLAKSAGKAVTVSYQMTINEEAKIDEGLYNSFDLAWNNNPNPDSSDETTTQHIPGKVPVYTGGAKFVKEDATSKAALQGAEFVLMNSEGKYFNGWGDVNSDGIKDVLWTDVQPTSGAGILTSNAEGNFEIAGLEYGTYSLKEVKAPDGYSLLTKTLDFEIKNGTYTGVISSIENSKKPTLPITGSVQLVAMVVGGVALISMSGVYYKKRRVN